MKPRLGLAFLLAAFSLAPSGVVAEADETGMGVISFPNSGAREAQGAFVRGVLALHNFWFEEAEEAFRKAQEIDPGFALAYWGEALSHNHPLWAEQDVAAARAALSKLGKSPAERKAKAGSPREEDYLEALEILYGEGDKLDRDKAYAKALARLSESYPEDDEAKVLHALALLGTVRPGDRGFARQMRAAAILADVRRRNPRHPGVAHFTIHSFDDPEHAPLSLEAADLYARIAPEAPHALHMPTHIYIQLGMWDRVLASNEAAYAASVKWVEKKGLSLSKRDFHSFAWGQYGALQLGQYAKARDMVPVVEAVAAQTGEARVKGTAASLRARYIVESRRWEDLPLPEVTTGAGAGADYGSRASLLVAAGLSAAHLGNPAKADEAAQRLRALAAQRKEAGSAYEAQPLEIMAVQVEGLTKVLKGDPQGGLEQLAAAARLEEKLDPPNGPTYPIKPSHELYAESLLMLGRTHEALAVFETSLSRMPRRSLSLLGLARAAQGSGDVSTAAEAYGQLGTIWAAADPGRELDEVRGYRPVRRAAAQP